jgi:chemosensory pili system protein ChpA (sensor histidine kinase/response regulator)
MAEPLLHLLRNAVDHGIELPQRRRTQGKSETGVIRTRARQENNQVVFEISDDGAGIDPSVVRRMAGQGGFAPPAELEAMTEEELFAMLFRPGFTTAQQVSEVSGRGVGLDIVMARVQQFQGTVTLASKPGLGSTFTIRLPVKLALLKALLIKAGGQTFAIPLSSIVQIARLHIDARELADDPTQITFGDNVAPRVDLARALGLKTAGEPTARPPVLLIRSNGRHLAVVVEQLGESREVVVKSLGGHLRQVHGVAGATLLGDGSVVLILNPDQLGQAPRPNRRGTIETSTLPAAEQSLTILVVDDSPSVRRVISRLLQGEGWTVLTARDGLEALEVLHHAPTQPDLMLVDIEMPRMDGYELVASVRNQAAHAHIPVVMVTSRASSKHRRQAEEVGANGFVVKPYLDEDLLATIRALVHAQQ